MCQGLDTVRAATPFRQKGRKFMSKRSGQAGQVFLRNGRWVGRFYVDEPGTSRRKRRAIVLGIKRELTRPEAKRKLLDLITQEGVNTPTHLERSQRSPTTFADVADAWELKRLAQLKESNRYTVPRLMRSIFVRFSGRLFSMKSRPGSSMTGSWICGYTHFPDSFKRDIVERLAPSWTHSEDLDSVAVAAKRS